MFNKLLYVVVVLGSIAAAIAAVGLAGCEPEVPKPPPETAPAVAPQVPPSVGGAVYCVDGWEAIYTGNGTMYRHAHDVNEHLISCQGGQ